MHSIVTIAFLLNPIDIDVKDIRTAKNLLITALRNYKSNERESDYEFLRNSPIKTDHLEHNDKYSTIPELH